MWDYSKIDKPTPYWGDETYRKAIEFLDGPGLLEDWGCGTTYAKKFVKTATYVGVDSSPSKFNDVTDTLSTRYSFPDFILMRHVLEHNYNWKAILKNALRSFQERMCFVIFTPFSNITHEIAYHYDIGVPDLSFRKGDLTDLFPEGWTEETVGPEHLFYLTL